MVKKVLKNGKFKNVVELPVKDSLETQINEVEEVEKLMQKNKIKQSSGLQMMSILLGIAGITFLFIAIWAEGWNIVRYALTGIILSVWSMGINAIRGIKQ